MKQSPLLLNDDKNGTDAETLLCRERLILLRKGLPAAITGNIVLAFILIYIQEPAFSLTVLLTWLTVMMLILLWRVIIFFQFNPQICLFFSSKQLIHFRASTIITGLLWASTPIFLFPENNIALQATLSFVLAGVCAGAASSLSMDKISALGFIVPPLVSLTAAFLVQGERESLSMALMTAVFLGFVTFSCVRSERQFLENIQLQSVALQREKALGSSEARLRSLFDLSPFGIVLSDYTSGDIIEMNNRFVTLSGYTRDEFLRLDQWEITPKVYELQEFAQRDLLARTGRYGPYEKELIRKDGSHYPVILNGVLIEEANGRKLVWSIVEDISDRKRIDKMKNEFISTVSHELRTPLTAISGALGLLNSHIADDLSEPMQNMLRIARSNSQRLSQLINDLLDIEKITSGKMDFNLQRHAVLPLVEQAIEINEPYALEYSVGLFLSEDSVNAHVMVDASRFQQVLANLLSNAIKFSPTGERVTLAILNTPNEKVRISITDVGPGIPTAFRSQIFQKFSQADSSDTRAKGGTGLGLAITKELVEKMGGTINFESIEGLGSTFWIELPTVSDGILVTPRDFK